jgi:hypothetical protein
LLCGLLSHRIFWQKRARETVLGTIDAQKIEGKKVGKISLQFLLVIKVKYTKKIRIKEGYVTNI